MNATAGPHGAELPRQEGERMAERTATIDPLEYVKGRRDLMLAAAAAPVGSVVVDPNDPAAVETLVRSAGFVEEMLYRLDPGSATERTVSKADLLNLAKDLERAYQRLGGAKQNIVKPGTVEQVKATVASVAASLRWHAR